jgi:hypothetical protein
MMIGCSSESVQRNAPSQNANGGAGPQADGGALDGSSGANSTFVLPENCAELGFDVHPGCETCPVEPPVCECLQGAPLVPEHRCTFGKCLTAFDCDRLCQNLNGPEFNQDLMAIQECLRVFDACDSDVDCGTGNRCVYSPRRVPPEWQCTAPGSFCNEDTDCLEGSRCIGDLMLSEPETGEAILFGFCSTGEEGTACRIDDDCRVPYRCAEASGFAEPLCSTGDTGAPCSTDDDCLTSHHCAFVEVGGAAQCSAGKEGDPCGKASDCQSGLCVGENTDPSFPLGSCTSGLLNAPCQGSEECQNGYCSWEVGASVGACVSGDDGSQCFNDTACASGLCGLNPNDSDGICVNGNVGSPCFDDADCRESTCMSPSVTTSTLCSGPGSPCEDDGVCVAHGECFKGKCG